MTPQDRLANAIADYLAAGSGAEVRRYVATIVDRLGLHRDEVRMWGFGVPTEDG